VKESTPGTTENQNHQIDRTAEYSGGTVDYSVLEGSSRHNPVIVVPGFTGGRVTLGGFAHELNYEGNRDVIYSEQPVLSKSIKNDLSVIDHHAQAILSIIKNEGLEDGPVDFVTHSMGAMTAVRAAELAELENIRSFDFDQGSHTVFIAPAGSNDKENLFFLGGRWAKFITKNTFYRRQLDPTGEMAKADLKNFRRDPAKTVREIWELRKKSDIYSYLGRLGLKPFVLGFANDSMYPDKVIGKVLEAAGESLSGYAVPVDNGGIGAANVRDFRKKSGYQPWQLVQTKKAWAHHYRNANHADLQHHPQRTVKAVLQHLDR
jgi:pimeloyl-ACP methyl ester carboxylesterase